MMGEAIISFDPELSKNIGYYRKQSAQLASKMRYLSAQFIPYIEQNIWLENATLANQKALKLAEILKQYPAVSFTQKVESNALFLTLDRKIVDQLLEKYYFYFWNEAESEIRLVTSWDTTDEDIEQFSLTLAKACKAVG